MRIGRLLYFMLLAFAAITAVNVLNRLPGPSPQESQILHVLSEARNKDLVVIGASTTYGINPEDICRKGARIDKALDVFEIESIVDFLLEQEEPPQIFIIVAAPNFAHQDSGSKAGYNNDHRKQLYRSLYHYGYRGIIGSDWRNLIVGMAMPALGFHSWEYPLRRTAAALGLAEPATMNFDAEFDGFMDERLAVQDAEQNLAIRRSQIARIKYFDARISERVMEASARIAKKIKKADRDVVFVSIPAYRSSLDMLEEHGDVVKQEFAETILSAKRAGADYLDFLDQDGISDDPSLFHDPDHLNVQGAARFTFLLRQRLSERDANSATCIR